MKNNRKARLLNVDDNNAGRYATTRILRQAGFEVQEAATGREALRLAEECPGLILLDVNLPDISGLEVCQELRANQRTAAIPIVHLSATFVSADDQAAGLEQGADAYLTHPVDPKVLVATIKAFLRLKMVENALRESEDRFRTTLRNSPVFVSNQDRELRYTWMYNPQPGFKPETALGKTDADLLAVGEAAHLTEIKRRALQSGAPVTEEVMETVGGQAFFYDLTAEPLRDADGNVVGVTSVLVDITERHRATKALVGILEDEKRVRTSLIDSEDNFRRSLDESPLGILIASKEGDILYANPATLDIFGIGSIEELQTTATAMHYTEWSHAEVKFRREKRGLGEDDTSEYEIDIVRKDGEVRRLQVWRKEILWNRNKHDQSIYRDITLYKRAEESLKETLAKLRRSTDTLAQALAATVEVRDPYTAGHQKRVARISRAIASETGLTEERTEGLVMASGIHDIGKISVPAEILSKPTRLSCIEFDLIKTHPQTAYDILKDIPFPWPIAEIVYQHHERLDGSGYPRGLKGGEIMLEARIMTVADVVEAMASHRPYRPSRGIEKALEEIAKNQGLFYDPVVVDACLRIIREKGFQLDGLIPG